MKAQELQIKIQQTEKENKYKKMVELQKRLLKII